MDRVLMRGGQPLVVFCSGSSWDSPVGTDRHMASRLARWAPVLFVDSPLSIRPKNFSRLREPQLRSLGPGLLRLTPRAVPGVTWPGLREAVNVMTRHAIASAVRRLGAPVHAVVAASLDNLFGACEESRRVLFGTDDFTAGAALMGISPSWVAAREKQQLRAATTIIAVSDEIAQRWRAQGYSVAVVQNGCDSTAFAQVDCVPAAPDIRLPQPIAGLVGQLSSRIDLDLLEAVADTGVSLLIVGPVRQPVDTARLQAVFERPNVQWVGERPFAELPGYLKAISVGITPYSDTAFNRASFPLKTLEYLAAGRKVVTSDLPSARALRSDLIRIAGTPEEFASSTLAELAREEEPASRERRRTFAAEHDWDRRAQDFAKLIALA